MCVEKMIKKQSLLVEIGNEKKTKNQIDNQNREKVCLLAKTAYTCIPDVESCDK